VHLFSHTHHMTHHVTHHVTSPVISYHVTMTMWHFSHTPFYIVSLKEKKRKRKRNINNNLAVMTLRTVIYSMLGLTIAWSLNAMGLDLPINMWSLTALNFFFSLIVTLILRSLLDWELSSILASISIRVLIEQQWRLVVEYKIKSRLIWIVSLLVQQKLAGRSLNSTCMKSH